MNDFVKVLGIGCGLLVLGAVAVVLVLHFTVTRKLDPDLKDPDGIVAGSHELLEQQLRDPALFQDWLFGNDIPQRIRFPELNRVGVHGDHVDLIIIPTPDGPMGLRVWASDARRPHADRPTRYPDILRFSYNNDFPEAPDNLP